MKDTTKTLGQMLNDPSKTLEQVETDRPMVWKRELEATEALLETPQPTLSMEPTVPSFGQFQMQMEERKGAFLAYGQERLNRLNHRARDDFNMTQMKQDLQEIDRER